MDESYEIRKGKKVRVGTPDSYFIGTIRGCDNRGEDLFLEDVEQIHYHFFPDLDEPREYKRKIGKVRIPEKKINHYEFLD